MIRKVLFLSVLLCAFCNLSFAQKKFAKISVADFATPAEAADSSADAVYIYNIGDTHFEILPSGFILRTQIKVRMHILTEKGKEYANQSVVYRYNEKHSASMNDKLFGLSAASYNRVDGKVVKTAMSGKYEFEEKVDEFLRNYAAQFGMNDRDMTRAELLKLFGMNEDSLKFSIRPAAEAQVKTELLLEAVAKAEGLEPTEEELQAYYEKTAKDVGATADDVKRYFGEDFLKNELKKEQAMNLIVGSAVAKSADEMDPEEAAKEMKEEFADEVAGEAVAEAVEQAEEKAE